ncbi:MAG: bifunctional aldolase/short-chain dehydrogenase [Planctomycetota bacterium]|nr:bifunctional aldolase/short-chain dehydrogenase [Planctomycetota bacterium]
MQSRYDEHEAQNYRERYAAHGDDVALRVYTSRLIGAEPALVLHGGGNTSVKTTTRDLFGRTVEVLCVKGSGSDLALLEPDGLPAVRLAALRELQELPQLSDQHMVASVRLALLDPDASMPSVETLLHAFLPHRFVDHTHADVLLALTNQSDGAQLVREALGADVPVLPWCMPGFPLAKAVAKAFLQQPDCRGIVLLKHGILTFGDTAKESYERMLALVSDAERFLAARGALRPAMLQATKATLAPLDRLALLAKTLPVLRGAVAMQGQEPWGMTWLRMLAESRSTDEVAAFASHLDARLLCAKNPITPDHVIRTKGRYLFLSRDEAVDPDASRRAIASYVADYKQYFVNAAPRGAGPMLRPMPIVFVIEGCGLVAFGPTRKAAQIAADIAEHTLRVKAQAQALGCYEALPDTDLAEMEYWPLELNKLGKQRPLQLAGQVALVTGAAGAIGVGITEALLQHGACVCLVDIDGERLGKVAQRFAAYRNQILAVTADLTDSDQVASAFSQCVSAFGGIDCVVPNAGIAHVSKLMDMDRKHFQQVFEVNATGTMLVLQAAARMFALQRSGGSVVVQASKNAFAPGAGFGAYSASKAAVLQLGRIAALELADLGVTVNMVNADAVFGDDDVPSQLWQQVGPDRMRARNLDAAGLREFYRQRSLLKTAVLPRHVGEAVVFFASGKVPTTGAVLPVDGGLPEAFPR